MFILSVSDGLRGKQMGQPRRLSLRDRSALRCTGYCFSPSSLGDFNFGGVEFFLNAGYVGLFNFGGDGAVPFVQGPLPVVIASLRRPVF